MHATASIVRELRLPVVVERVLDVATQMTGAQSAALGVLDAQGQIDHVFSRTRSGVVTLTPGVTDSDWAAMRAGVDDMIETTITVRKGVFGYLRLVPVPDRAVSPRDTELVAALASTAGTAIENAALYEESELRRKWLIASNDVMRELIDAAGEQPLSLIVRQTSLMLNADLCGMALRLDDDHVVIKVATPGYEHLVGKLLPGSPESLGGRALRSAVPVVGRGPFPHFAAMEPAVSVSEVIAVPLVGSDEVLGLLYAARSMSKLPFTAAEVDVTAGFASQAALALELARSRDDREAVKLMEDRERIAGDLHDHVIQQLFAVGMGMQSLAGAVRDQAQVDRVNSYVDAIDETIARIRTTISTMNSPPIRQPVGLVKQLNAVAVGSALALGFPPGLHVSGPVDEIVETQLVDDIVAVAREALSNVARHAGATSATLSVTHDRNVVTVEVVDNGRGIATPRRSSGLKYANRRARRYGGSFEVVAPVTGGTRLVWTVPWAAG